MGLGIGMWRWFGNRNGAARVRALEAGLKEDMGWRRAAAHGSTWTNPDRDELDGEALLRAAYRAYRTNPLAYAIIEQTTRFLLEEAARVGLVGPRANRGVVVRFEEPSMSPIGEMAGAVKELTEALGVAIDKGLVSVEEARKLWWRYQGQVDESAPQGGEGSR